MDKTIKYIVGILVVVTIILPLVLRNPGPTITIEHTGGLSNTATLNISVESSTTPESVFAALNPFVFATSSNLHRVTRVVDGDTVVIDTGDKVRYIGIDTPETVSPTKPVQCFGKEASAFNTQLVGGKLVRLEKDISERDKYGRLLRFVYLEDGTDVNLVLVQNGYAHAATFPPDVRRASEFLVAEREARTAHRGLWSSCPVK